MQRDELRLREFGEHVGQSHLLDLKSTDRLVEHHAGFRVGHRFFKTRHRGAKHAPRDAVARLREAHERALEPLRFGENRISRHVHIGENEFRRVAGSERELAMLVLGMETRQRRIDDEAADAGIVGAVTGLGPDDGHVRLGSIGDPHLAAIDDPAAVGLLPGTGDHARRIRPVVGFGEAEATDHFRLREFGQIVLLLRLRAERENRIHNQGALH